MLPNPLIPGFNPDPSIVRADDAYYLVTSSFEYLPGIPVYRSTDMVTWEHVGNVITRPEQAGLENVSTNGGVWAPTIRHRDGVFYVIVTIAMSSRGCVVFTATDPAGPWSDGTTLEGVGGVDPDLAWDDDAAYVTYSGFMLNGPEAGRHKGIQQVRVDLEAGKALEEPRPMWSGTGLKAPEAPHLYQRGDHWYLLIAEGGTERGHSVSIARGPAPEGPFVGHPANPFLSARGTNRPIQNTGHADLVSTPDGDVLVMLGMRPLGGLQSFSPLGRETFATSLTWVDGWPYAEPVRLAPRPGTEEELFRFADATVLAGPGWLSVRATPAETATVADGRLSITGTADLDHPHVRFLGRRQRHMTSTFTTVVDARSGKGGLASRYDEHHWFALEAHGTTITAKAHLAGLAQSWQIEVPPGEIELRIETSPPPAAAMGEVTGGDRIRLYAGDTLVTELDGRYWTAETCASFTGRVTGMYASGGTVSFTDFRYTGRES
ncbi:glycoside hydrolase family 43 protein [Streptosporangium sp. NBC_01639]|uniref:glycoside hydrolase family 43 protein n=1 Tax=Streptosporangium sp. NBC_01639 TaxID=2975948 RepID=UPI00386800F6|nr:glycoside hydrolase family 43 protein [Streptosporangium sp. NBC_01639]